MKRILSTILLFVGLQSAAQFIPGNLVIYRVGDGSAVLTSAATPVFIDEYSPAGALVQSLAMPTAAAGANKRITASGTATSEGLITRSVDGRFVLLTGYDAAPGTASITGSTGTTINRVVGRLDPSGVLDATTALTDLSSGGNPRSAVSTNGTDIWATGSAGGIRYFTLGSTTSTQLSTTVTNLRYVNIFSNQLYVSTSSGTAVRLGTVGTGTPTSSGQVITSLPGLPTSTGSPYGFFFADIDPTTPGVDVLYLSDDAAPGFQKYSLVGGTWVANGNIAVTGNTLRSIVGVVSGTSVTLYGVTQTSLVSLTDASGYNATITGTVSVLASAAANTAFRGVAFAPQNAPAPSLTITSPLAAFGNVCISTSAGPNSFTIGGTNLTTADVTVAALAGYTYSTTSGGTYTSSLTITQPGGSFSQPIFVRFDPTAVQSYNGNIAVAGGGVTTPVNVAASGAGVNTLPTVSSGSATGISTTGATVAGTISANGCTAVSAYGIEYSTTAGFPNGTGTPVPASNLAAGNFSSTIGGLVPATTYYYHAYATNGGGTAYGAEQSFATDAAVPTLSAGTLTAFGDVCINTTAGPNSFTVSGVNLTAANVTVGPLSGYQFATSAGGPYSNSLDLVQPGGTFSQTVFVQFLPVAVQSYAGNIPVAGGGATAIQVAASGAGVNTLATVVTGSASGITTTGATLAGTISANGCSAVTAYGIEYSTTAGFPNGTGTQVPSSNLSGGNFSSAVSGLTPGTPYYYKAYATNSGGTAYGAEQNFATLALTPTLSATALTGFGNVCVNSTAGPNSFTINGSALNTTNVTVGPLAGYSFATVAGGPYTASLSLTQPGGTYSQVVFVNFTPVAVQSYDGNILVGGGGATSINVAVTGSGINTAPSVTTGAASAITSVSATAAGSVPAAGCSAISAYGIEYSTVNGFPDGSGTQVPASNLSGGNFSASLTGLAPSTTYYYKAWATNSGGTTWGAQQSFTTATPLLSVSALTGFGNVCLNTTAGPNSFTITGTQLTAANVTIGPLAGYTFATTSGGTYSASLSLTQPGGAYSQTIFVRFTPVAVQSYNGSIPVAGGGAAATSAAVTGAGINTAPTVSTGAASAITFNSATAAGSIPATGCTAVTAYGIEYSTVNGFPNGSGTQVTASNLSGGNFSASLTGLAANTVYYYKAFATNGGGTSYGAQQTFTTLPVPISLTATALAPFGNQCVNTSSTPNSFTINGSFLTNAPINVGPLAGYAFSTSAGGTYSPSLMLTQPGGTYTQTVFVQFTPPAVQTYNGNIPVSGGGFATPVSVAASGAGVNTLATVITGAAASLTTFSATLAGSVAANGCSAVTEYGVEYSGISGFVNGSGTRVAATGITGGNFTVPLNGLVQGTTYYYKAYAVNNGGISYGLQQSFTLPAIRDQFVIYPAPAMRGQTVRVSRPATAPGYYALQFINGAGQLAFQYNLHLQAGFINQAIPVPGQLTPGIYRVLLVSQERIIDSRSLHIF